MHYAEGEKAYELYVDGEMVISGHQADVREKIEELLEEKLGYFVQLQECSDEGYLQVYLHTDNLDDMDDADYENLTNVHGVDMYGDYDDQTLRIKALCNITAVKEVRFK